MKILKQLALINILSVFALAGPLAVAGGSVDDSNGDSVPSKYEVTVKKVEFRTTGGSFVTFYSGSEPMDLAAVAANTAAGSVGAGIQPQNGTYDGIRITIDRDITINGSASNAGGGQMCRTGSTVGTTVAGGVTFPNAISGAGVAADQIVTAVPPEVEATFNAIAVFNLTATEMEMTFDISQFVIDPQASTPTISMDFNVDNSVEFLTTAPGACVVLLLPPSVEFTINGTTTSYAVGGQYAY